MIGFVCVRGGRFFMILRICFLCFYDWLYVCFRAVVGSPDRDSSDQVWECVHVVDVFHFVGG